MEFAHIDKSTTKMKARECTNNEFYYGFSSWIHYLKQLQDIFCQRHEKFVVITGANGSGKSTLLAKFASSLDKEVYVNTIEGNSELNLRELIHSLQDNFDIKLCKDEIITLEQIDQIVYQALHVQHIYLLVIDDAHKMPVETLEAILRIANNRKDSIRLSIILSGDVYLKKRIACIQERLGRSQSFFCLELMPLTLTESNEYVRFWLKKANVDDRSAFSQVMLQRVYNLSGGFPGRINRIAQQILRDRIKFEQQYEKYEENKEFAPTNLFKFTKIAWLFIPIFIFFGGFYLYFHFHQTQIKHTVIAEQKYKRPHVVVKRNKPKVKQEEAYAYIPSIADLPIENIQRSKAPVNPINNASNASETQTTTVAVKSQPLETSVAIPAVSSPGFTIQLMGGSNRAALNQYLDLPSIRNKVRVVHTLNQGKDWYVLVYGQFKDQEEARIAMQQLPELLKIQKPWIRSWATLSE